jgi:tight adherence protein C
MNAELAFHLLGVVFTFAAVSIGSYGLMRQIVLLGLWPSDWRRGGPVQQELQQRLGAIAAERGWFTTMRNGSQRDLVRARMVEVTPDDFVGQSILYGLLGLIGGWLVTILVGGTLWNVVPAVVASAILFQVPGWNLRSAANRRITLLSRRLPYSLEVVVLATEAGAGFEEALGVLVREDPKAPLHEEFDQVLRDAHLGMTRREALHAMAARVDTEDVNSLVMALDVADDLGTPIGEMLKKQAETIRHARLTRAEKMAREAGPKMALPNTMIMVANVLLILAPFLPKLSMSGF